MGWKVRVSGALGLISTWGSVLFLEKLSGGAPVLSSVDPPLTAPDLRFQGQAGIRPRPHPLGGAG